MTLQRKRNRPRRVRLEDFLALEDAHPYGCLPEGNRFFGTADERAAASDPTRRHETKLLTDELWQDVLSFCDASSLSTIVQTTRYFYVAGHQPELWRDLVLRKCYSQTPKRVIDHAIHSWRDTYVCLFVDSDHPPHHPIFIPGIYSDEYYRTHRCRSFAIPEAWLKENQSDDEGGDNSTNTIPIITVDSTTPSKFMDTFEAQNQPVLVQNAVSTSPALKLWQDFEYLRKHNATNKSFRTTSGTAPLSANFTLEAYKAYSQFQYLEESPLYLFDRTAFDDNDQWKQDFFPAFYDQCPWWDPAAEYGHDLLQHLGEEQRPDHTWLIMGPKRSGSVFHIDPNCTHAWNVCVQGRKRWIFYPPGVSPPGVFPSADGDEVAVPLSVGEWIHQFWPEHLERCRSKTVNERPLECTVHSGDVVFVPHGWWHMVINLDDTNIAITHNYVSPSNLGNALKFFAEKQDQISGCRDRSKSVKPEHIHEALVKALGQHEPMHIENAQQQRGWTCKAWKKDDSGSSSNTADTSNGNHEPLSEDAGSKKTRIETETDTTETGKRNTTSCASVMAKTEKISSFTFSFL